MELKSLKNPIPVKGPVTLLVLDGVGLNPSSVGNAVKLANTPTLDHLMKDYPTLPLKAHGTAVGLPSDQDMGNSEVGHNALGSGQIFAQGAKLVSNSISSGKLYEGEGWKKISKNALDHHSTLHFIGLFSDGNVHSHIDHLKAMICEAKKEGIKTVRIHILLDGRDVAETSALEYVEPFEEFLASLNDTNFDAKIASGGGRMKITMDRYEANWPMVKAGWDIHVLGKGRMFSSAKDAIQTYRKELGVIDQDLPGFVIADNGTPVGTIQDNDSVIFFNFRGDRSIEISRAFGEATFDKFDRERFPNIVYAGMLEYDGDLHIPANYLVAPPEISGTMGEYLAMAPLSSLAVSETQKYGHVTYFWNGNRSGKYSEEKETYIEIPSDVVPFEQRPWMKCAEITDVLVDAIQGGKYRFIRANFPNGDMVGHTGSLKATMIGMESLDLCLDRIVKAVDQAQGILLICADHGNADEMLEIDKKTKEPKKNADGSLKAKTSHTLAPVPFIIYDPHTADCYRVKSGAFGLANVAATVTNLLGYKAPDFWMESMICAE